ncbi:MAG: DUF2892 domain-containing protein [Deltaproteobacteria bacterium]|nr:DUF2892 domain-containing protein [Deltaproteobacteria bacterium]
MHCNVGKTDKAIRFFMGLAVIGAGIYFQSWWGALGVVPLMTAITGRCGAYSLLGMSTCKLPDRAKKDA